MAAYDTSATLVVDPEVTAYAVLLSGDVADQVFAIAVDAVGNSYVTGNTTSTTFPATQGVFQQVVGGGTDAFVAQISEAGGLVYSTFLGGSLDDAGRGIAVDGTGNVYVTGFTLSANFPTLVPFQNALGGLEDTFVVKLAPGGGALVYSTFLGGALSDIGLGIAADMAGSAYVTGGTRSPLFPTTAGVFQTSARGGRDAFVTKFNATGGVVYSTFLGGGADDAGNGIAVDSAGNASLTGFTGSTNFPTTPGAFQPAFGGMTDAFVARLDAAGSALVYSTYLGGSDVDTANGIALDSSAVAYITGTTASTHLPDDGARLHGPWSLRHHASPDRRRAPSLLEESDGPGCRGGDRGGCRIQRIHRGH